MTDWQFNVIVDACIQLKDPKYAFTANITYPHEQIIPDPDRNDIWVYCDKAKPIPAAPSSRL